ncbi:MAG: TMEM175 family protein [Chitinophagales bacterium]
MSKTRLEAFSDGVMAIIITIMVLEFKVPENGDLESLIPLVPTFISYLLSFLFIGIYWGNHHHLLHPVKHISSGIMLANLNLLFWLSLVPFATGWMGENNFEPPTVALYAILLNFCGISYTILQQTIVKYHDFNPAMKNAMRKQSNKGKISVIAYTAAIPLAYIEPFISEFLFFAIGVLWLLPDKNIERATTEVE